VRALETAEVAVGKMKAVTLEGKEVLIANVEGKHYAIGNRCTHRGGDLSKGILKGTIVTCPRHKSQFDVTTGKVISGPRVPLIRPKIRDEPLYEVKTDGPHVLVKLE
jgi:3-phenylpropionate/trans-cinnamate dioxygenase ferredoxin subunit